jgi:hypothetical protein
MTFLEKDLEDIIFQATHEQLSERGLYVVGKKFRQFKIGNYGIADMIAYQRPFYHPAYNSVMKGCITIYELKKDTIGMSTFNQLIRYANGVKLYLEEKGISGNYDISLVAIGKDVELSSSFCYLPNLFNHDISESTLGINEPTITFDAYKYLYDFDGISFDEISGYRLKDNGF